MSDIDRRPDDSLPAKARRALDDQPLSPRVQRRLAQARQRAVRELGAGRPRWVPDARWALPAGAAAAALVAFALVRDPGTDLAMPALDDDEMAAVMDLELLDDIEFLAWMLEQEADAG